LDALGRPDLAFPVLMVTGSKGKGSTAFYLARILEAHGLDVGFFSSPHLLDHRERIRKNRRAIPAPALLETLRRLAPALASIRERLPPDQYVGPVGILAAAAALWFADEGVDVAVFETGRGARFDDVARVRHEGAVLGPVFLEHRAELGNTLADVAWHKAGVIRPETMWAVAADQAVLLRAARRQAAGRPVWADSRWPLAELSFDVGGVGGVWLDERGEPHRVQLPTLARWGIDNARRALIAARQWLGPRFDWPVASQSLADARMPGRAELLPTRPPVLLDGTIRRESAAALVEAARRAGLLPSRAVAVVGVPADKDWQGVAAAVAPWASLIFARATNARLAWPPEPERAFPFALGVDHFVTAWEHIRRMRPQPDLVLALGTQSFVADVVALLDPHRVLDLV
jgi:dihydrofolate synthase/folylpolyglutamate synthase